MKLELVMPYLMIVEALLASLFYGYCKNWNMAIYWLSGATITWTVTRMGS